MSLSLRRKLQKTLTLSFFISLWGTAALAQGLNTYNHVVSVVEDKGGRFVLVGTSRAKMAPRPYVQYFPGENGSTIMVADFPDLVFDRPTTIFTPPVSGLIQVRFAQLQLNPPVFRIAITTAEADILKRLEFHTQPGTLIIKWPASYCRVFKAPEKITFAPYAPPSITFTPTVMPHQAPILSAPIPGSLTSTSTSASAAKAPYDPSPSISGPLPTAPAASASTAKHLSTKHDVYSAGTGSVVGAGPCPAHSEPERHVSNTVAPERAGRHRVSPLQSDRLADSHLNHSKAASQQSDLLANSNLTNGKAASQQSDLLANSNLTNGKAASQQSDRLADSHLNHSKDASQQSDRLADSHLNHSKSASQQSDLLANSNLTNGKGAGQQSTSFAAKHLTAMPPAKKSVQNIDSTTNVNNPDSKGSLRSSNSSTSKATSAMPPQAPAPTSGITANNQTENAIPKPAPDFHLPHAGPISMQDSQSTAPADLPPIKDKPFDAQAAVPPLAMLAASQVTGQGQPHDLAQSFSAQTFLDKVKRTASYIESTSQNSVQKLLPQIAKETNLLVGQTATPETKPVQTIAISGFCPLKILLTANSTLSYNAFRLHEPERYVIDVQGLPDLSQSAEPSLPDNGFVNDLRVGHGEQDSNRLIFDLSGSDIPIKETLSGDKKSLALVIGEGVDLFARLQAPRNTVVVLDAGHGGSDPGAERGDIQEKEITLDIVERLKNYLQSKGLKVILTRTNDTFVSLEDRVNITNSAKPDCFVSVHVNSMETTSTIHGIETYYQTPQSRQLASLIHDSLVDNLSAPDRTVRKARFYVVNHTPIPAILAEVGFISNKEERERLISSDYQAKVAEALADGVILYLDKRDAISSLGESADKQAGAGGRALSNRSGTVSK